MSLGDFLREHEPRTLGEELDMPEFQRELYRLLDGDFHKYDLECDHAGYVDEDELQELTDALADVYAIVTDFDSGEDRLEIAQSVYEIIQSTNNAWVKKNH